jgi:predicted nuclease of restriction endonuclease-like RecB superfamily
MVVPTSQKSSRPETTSIFLNPSHYPQPKVQAMEVIGFWTTEYLREKVEALRLFRDQPIILAVGQAGTKRITGLPEETIFFKSVLKLNSVLGMLNKIPS